VEVADHGPGIPLANRLEVFRRGVTWRPPGYEETPGAGVGLFVARAHLLGHGGGIEIEDRPETEEDAGPGTVFRLTLPPVA
jgi:signal transduction histidine kinase